MDNVNSIGAYVRSITRAAGFRDMRPRLRQVLLGENEEVTEGHRHLHHHEDDSLSPETSRQDSNNTSYQDAADPGQHFADEQTPLIENGKPADDESTELAPLHSHLSGNAMQRVEQLAAQREESGAQTKDGGREPLLVTKVHRSDGTEAEVIVGQSTLPQTIFNSSNVLIGVGILSLPLGIKYAGWIIGLTGLLASALISKYTAGLLAKCIDVDSSLANFADIAYVAYGEPGRVITSSLITLELMVACVGLVILFADTLASLIDGPSPVLWKVLCGCILAPLQFAPMSLLGFSSSIGVLSNVGIIVVGLVMGLVKAHTPGSLREVATTYALPEHWPALPLSFGLIMGGSQ